MLNGINLCYCETKWICVTGEKGVVNPLDFFEILVLNGINLCYSETKWIHVTGGKGVVTPLRFF